MILLNGEELIIGKFPNGETDIDKEQLNRIIKSYKDNSKSAPRIPITFKYMDDSDLIRLMFIRRHLETLNMPSDLLITYMPYSTRDNIGNDGVFTLKYICEFINTLNFSTVMVLQPYSNITPALLNNCKVIKQGNKLLEMVIASLGSQFNKNNLYIYYPGIDAYDKFRMVGYKSIIGLHQKAFGDDENRITMFGDLPNKKEDIVIMVDDLCAKGEDFQLAAETIEKMGVGKIHLVVSHCENSIIEGDIIEKKTIDTIFTTNSILSLPLEKRPDNIIVYQVMYTL